MKHKIVPVTSGCTHSPNVPCWLCIQELQRRAMLGDPEEEALTQVRHYLGIFEKVTSYTQEEAHVRSLLRGTRLRAPARKRV